MNVVPGHDLRQLLHADLPIVVDVKKSKRLLNRTSWKHLSTLLCTKPWEGSGLCPGPPLTWPWITFSENNQSLCCADHLQCPLSSVHPPFVLSVTVTADFEVKPQLHVCHFACSAPFHWTQLWSSPLISLCQKLCLHDSMISSTYLIQVLRRVILFQPQEMKNLQLITLHQIPNVEKFQLKVLVLKHYVGSGAHQGLREIGNWFLLWRKPGRGWEEHENCTFYETTNRAFPIFSTEKKNHNFRQPQLLFYLRKPLVGLLAFRY